MCERQQVKFGWQHVNANPQSTFVSSDGRIKSCIDHFLASANMFYDVNSVNVLKHPLHLPESWYRPIQFVVKL